MSRERVEAVGNALTTIPESVTVHPKLKPILTPLWVMLLTGERPGGWALVGATLVLGAVLLRGFLSILMRRS